MRILRRCLNINRGRRFLQSRWVVLLVIGWAVLLPGHVMGARLELLHFQENIDLYLPIVVLQRETRNYLPVIIVQNIPDIANPGFEQGYTGWVFSSNQGADLISQLRVHNGSYSASLGNGSNYRTASISQDLSVPAGRSTLAFWIYIELPDACGWDFLRFYINNQLFSTFDICSSTSTYQWSQRNLDLSGYTGQVITLRAEFTSDIAIPSYVYVDDFQFPFP